MYQYVQEKTSETNHQRFSTDRNLSVSRQEYVCGSTQLLGEDHSNGYELMLIIKGNALLKEEDKSSRIKERDVLYVCPQRHSILTVQTDLSYIKIYFNQNYLRTQGISLSSGHSYQLFRSNFAGKFSLTKEEFKDLYSDVLALEKRLRIPPDVPHLPEIIRNSFLEIVYDLFLIKNRRVGHESIKPDTKLKITNRFLELLSEKFMDEKRVNYYASALCVTPRHLSQVVKLTTDKTAKELVNEVVIKEAKLLLQSPNFNISEVASILRFADASFFGKYFKKQTGISPSSYKFSTVIAV